MRSVAWEGSLMVVWEGSTGMVAWEGNMGMLAGSPGMVLFSR